MPSPFPGMDPYLEVQPYWADLHTTMISVMKAELNRRLPEHYSAWSDIYVWLHEPDAQSRRSKPDVFVTSPENAEGGRVATLPAPATSILPAVRREGNKYLKIKETRSGRVVTVIELISPANKEAGPDRDAFLSKRNDCLASKTNIVEIDLLHEGQRLPAGDPPPASDYCVLVCRAIDFPKTALWPFSIRQPLPEIAVPLNPADGFLALSLKKCFDEAYDQGSYRKSVEYDTPPAVAMNANDREWAANVAASRFRHAL